MRKKNSSFALRFFLFMILFSTLFGGGSFIFNPLFLFSGIFDVVFMVLGVVILISVISIISSAIKEKKKQDEIANVSLDDLMSVLNNVDGNKIIINDEIYLLIGDKNNVTLDNVDIFMRDEYIGTLNEYQDAFPNAFNTLSVNLIKKLGKTKKSKKKNKTEEVIQTVVEEVKSEDKECAFYINKFSELNNEIENTQVKSSIEETINYLKEVKKIEDEFGESKDKTRKLYQYYLPMYVDILANYDRLHDNAPDSDEFRESETKVLKTSSLINGALKTLSSSLVENYYTNLNVDMKTLESILKKDGLVNDMKEEVK